MVRALAAALAVVSVAGVVTSEADARRRGGSRTARPKISRSFYKSKPTYAPSQVCQRRFVNGDIVGHGALLRDGPHEIRVKNDASGPVLVKVSDDKDVTFAQFYVERAAAATLSGIPDGDYVVRYASDPVLKPDCETLLDASSADKFPGPKQMAITTDSAGNRYSAILEYTLYQVANGNVQPQAISLPEFNND